MAFDEEPIYYAIHNNTTRRYDLTVTYADGSDLHDITAIAYMTQGKKPAKRIVSTKEQFINFGKDFTIYARVALNSSIRQQLAVITFPEAIRSSHGIRLSSVTTSEASNIIEREATSEEITAYRQLSHAIPSLDMRPDESELDDVSQSNQDLFPGSPPGSAFTPNTVTQTKLSPAIPVSQKAPKSHIVTPINTAETDNDVRRQSSSVTPPPSPSILKGSPTYLREHRNMLLGSPKSQKKTTLIVIPETSRESSDNTDLSPSGTSILKNDANTAPCLPPPVSKRVSFRGLESKDRSSEVKSSFTLCCAATQTRLSGFGAVVLMLGIVGLVTATAGSFLAYAAAAAVMTGAVAIGLSLFRACQKEGRAGSQPTLAAMPR